VITAGTAAEGLAQLASPPCCIVLDLMLPDGPGETILRQVRADRLGCRVAVRTGTIDGAWLDSVRERHPRSYFRSPST
jgi:DNA-binding response OmpR family regulator